MAPDQSIEELEPWGRVRESVTVVRCLVLPIRANSSWFTGGGEGPGLASNLTDMT